MLYLKLRVAGVACFLESLSHICIVYTPGPGTLRANSACAVSTQQPQCSRESRVTVCRAVLASKATSPGSFPSFIKRGWGHIQPHHLIFERIYMKMPL